MNVFKIVCPIDGDMLNERDGVKTSNGDLIIKVKVNACKGSNIKINGLAAVVTDSLYVAEVKLSQYKNVINVTDENSGFSENIIVYRLNKYTMKYRVSLDDNIWFLQDIAKQKDKYNSVFDNPYLGFFKSIHNTYGTKVHINIYYKTDDGFDLTMMPDKYKSEWKENADWIRLSFHAYADKPDKPYLGCSYEKVKHDAESVIKQIRRFAGEEVLGPVTTLHWGEATVDGCLALRDLGYKCLVADFNVDNELADRIPVSYYLDLDKRRNMFKRFIWKDNLRDIIFFRSAIITDCHKLNDIETFLDNIYGNPHQSGYMDLLIHEQYFYNYYAGYQPDYKNKVITAVKWAVDKGYKPAFLEECIFD